MRVAGTAKSLNTTFPHLQFPAAVNILKQQKMIIETPNLYKQQKERSLHVLENLLKLKSITDYEHQVLLIDIANSYPYEYVMLMKKHRCVKRNTKDIADRCLDYFLLKLQGLFDLLNHGLVHAPSTLEEHTRYALAEGILAGLIVRMVKEN